MSRLPLPPQVTARLEVFFDAKVSGTVILQVRDGVVLAYEIQERGTPPKDELAAPHG